MDIQESAAHRIREADATSQRAGSILDPSRPVWRWQSPAVPAEIAAIAKNISPKVVRVAIKMANESLVDVATAWPIKKMGNATIFITAGHVLAAVLPEGVTLRHCDLRGASTRNCVIRSRITDDPPIPISGWICAAPLDVALFAVDAPFDPLPLQTTPPASKRVVVLGYPLAGSMEVFIQANGNPDYPGKQFLSGGLFEPSGLNSFTFLHDASTLPGHSGSPVVDLQTGGVVGLHIWGAGYRNNYDQNDALSIPAILSLPWLEKIIDTGQAVVPPNEPALNFQGIAYPESWPSNNIALSELLAPQRLDKPPIVIAEDRSDPRDRKYRPGLSAPRDEIIPTRISIGNQLDEGSCAAFAVAAAIERQLARAPGYDPGERLTASVRMLDRMARRHDEWLDDSAQGTSLRAVLKGFDHNGVCPEADCPYLPGNADFFLTRHRAKKARELSLGGYFRVKDAVNDMRMAIQEAGAVICTARIHAGWQHPESRLGENCGVIRHFAGRDRGKAPRYHAFVVDGYNSDGFIVQSSQGPAWGGYIHKAAGQPERALPGHALWTFDDWAENCRDAWVIRLAPRSGRAFGVSVRGTKGVTGPRRMGLLGHIAHSESTGLVEDGTLGLGARGVAETAAYLDGSEAHSYRHLLLICPDPLWGQEAVTRLALQTTLGLKARRIYPFHIVHGLDDMLACRLRLLHDASQIAAQYLPEKRSRDLMFERLAAPLLRSQIESYRKGLLVAMRGGLARDLAPLPLFAAGTGGTVAGQPRCKLSVLSFGLGAFLARELLRQPDFKPAKARHLCVAPASAMPPRRSVVCWPLGNLRDDSDLPGYNGSWGDLVAAAQGLTEFRAATGLSAPTPQAALDDPEFITRLARWTRQLR